MPQSPQSSVKTFPSLPQIPSNPFDVNPCYQPQPQATTEPPSISHTILNDYKFITSFTYSFTHHSFTYLIKYLILSTLCQAPH